MGGGAAHGGDESCAIRTPLEQEPRRFEFERRQRQVEQEAGEHVTAQTQLAIRAASTEIDGQREAIYAVRRKVLTEGQAPLRERLVRYVEWVVDEEPEEELSDASSEPAPLSDDDLLVF